MTWNLPPVGQRVAVFLDEAASGATLGYYGQFVGVPLGVRMTVLGRPERIRVHVPFLGRVVDVDILSVFFCPQENRTVSEPISIEPMATVRFHQAPLVDNEEIQGFFRSAKMSPGAISSFAKHPVPDLTMNSQRRLRKTDWQKDCFTLKRRLTQRSIEPLS